MRELEVAKKAAIEAGKKILEIYEKDEIDMAMKTQGDYVSHITEADTAANKIIVDALRSEFSHAILTEEEKDNNGRLQKGVVWIIDPLDGTKEFINRRGEFTVNIALTFQGQPVMGVIYVPVKDELYYAVKDNGAFLGDKQITVTKKNNFSDMVLVTSRSHAANNIAALKDYIGFKDMIISGSSLKGCLVASGAAEAYIRLGPVNEWDICAMDIIAREAQAKMTDLNGKPLIYNKQNVLIDSGFLVSNGSVHDQILEKIKEFSGKSN